jgi:hypothetical protein
MKKIAGLDGRVGRVNADGSKGLLVPHARDTLNGRGAVRDPQQQEQAKPEGFHGKHILIVD